MLSEDPTPDEIQQLVELSKGGDMQAYEQLVKHYTPRLLSLVYGMLRNQQDSQDLVQEALIRAYRALGKFEAKSSFYTWIYRITYNLTLNFIKASRRKPQVSIQEKENHLPSKEYQDESLQSNPERQLEVSYLQKKLNDALKQLSEKHRAVVVMFDIDGLPHGKIAEIMGISVGTVRSRLHYAHQQLQTILNDINH